MQEHVKDSIIAVLERVRYVAAVVSIVASAAALPINLAGGKWRLAALNVGCVALATLFFYDRRCAGGDPYQA